ncbi:hypothetical protein F5Y11DRAFT_343856 [Daldinia sp. FL1419]|nr:hypothetical protein F5Y11DRAFT_343856 [Daldinia sp. FL1419]
MSTPPEESGRARRLREMQERRTRRESEEGRRTTPEWIGAIRKQWETQVPVQRTQAPQPRYLWPPRPTPPLRPQSALGPQSTAIGRRASAGRRTRERRVVEPRPSAPPRPQPEWVRRLTDRQEDRQGEQWNLGGPPVPPQPARLQPLGPLPPEQPERPPLREIRNLPGPGQRPLPVVPEQESAGHGRWVRRPGGSGWKLPEQFGRLPKIPSTLSVPGYPPRVGQEEDLEGDENHPPGAVRTAGPRQSAGPRRSAGPTDWLRRTQPPPAIDFFHRFVRGARAIPNSSVRGLCGFQAIIHSIRAQLQEVFAALQVPVPEVDDLINVYEQYRASGRYEQTFREFPGDRALPGPFQLNILADVLLQWSRLYPALPPLALGVFRWQREPFAANTVDPGSVIVWISDSGNHWEGVGQFLGHRAAMWNMIHNFRHLIYETEVAPEWFLEMITHRHERQIGHQLRQQRREREEEDRYRLLHSPRRQHLDQLVNRAALRRHGPGDRQERGP